MLLENTKTSPVATSRPANKHCVPWRIYSYSGLSKTLGRIFSVGEARSSACIPVISTNTDRDNTQTFLMLQPLDRWRRYHEFFLFPKFINFFVKPVLIFMRPQFQSSQ